jgi:hypothetical protein
VLEDDGSDLWQMTGVVLSLGLKKVLRFVQLGVFCSEDLFLIPKKDVGFELR